MTINVIIAKTGVTDQGTIFFFSTAVSSTYIQLDMLHKPLEVFRKYVHGMYQIRWEHGGERRSIA